MEHFPISEIQASGSVQLYESEDLGDVDDGLVRSWIGRLLLCAWSANALDSSNTPFRSQGPFTDAAHTGFQSTTLQYKMIHREPLHCTAWCYGYAQW